MFGAGTGFAAARHSWTAGAARSASLPSPTHQWGRGTLPAARYVPDSGSQRLVSFTFRMPARRAAKLAGALKPTAVTIPEALMASADIGRTSHFRPVPFRALIISSRLAYRFLPPTFLARRMPR